MCVSTYHIHEIRPVVSSLNDMWDVI